MGGTPRNTETIEKIDVFHGFGVFRGVPPMWGFFLASCWPLAGLFLAFCWLLAGLLLASCWLAAGFLLDLAGLFLASCWPLAGFLLASSFPTRISLENQFLGKLAKTVNSLHENGCFSMVSVFRGVPPVAGLFLASCWLLAGVLLACCWLLLASCWPLAGLLLVPGLLLASCWLQASPRGFL